MKRYRFRRLLGALIILIMLAIPVSNGALQPETFLYQTPAQTAEPGETYDGLAVKGRAPKTGYSRDQFGDGWEFENGCDMRNRILVRDLIDERVNEECKVLSGILNDPYTGKRIPFMRGEDTSDDVQIDHVVALSNAWQTGAQYLSFTTRVELANDPLNLLAVEGVANQQKSDGDAATWLPSNKSFRCQYVNRQMKVKQKYELWVTPAERDAIKRVRSTC